MPFLRLAEVVGRHPSLYFAAYVPVVGLCIFLRISSFFRLGSKTLSVPVVCLDASFLLVVVSLMSAILDSLRGFHRSRHFYHSVACIPGQRFLIGELRLE